MRDPREGVSPSGTIVTGARRDRVPATYESVLVAASDLVQSHRARGSLYLYGSVATGQARVPSSDVDLWTINVGPHASSVIGRALSRRFSGLCRAVNIRTARTRDYLDNTDAAYGKRVFLRHYCVHLSGVAHHESLPDFPADVRAARGLNGDIAIRAQRWRRALREGGDRADLARRLARKSLLVVGGLVSIHDGTWTTDRAGSARRWAEIDPELGRDLGELVSWMDGQIIPTRADLSRILGGLIRELVSVFDARIGLWR
jgi:uncharacterized protein